MARHHDRAFDVRRVQAEIVDKGFGESLYRKFRSTVGGMRHTRPAPVRERQRGRLLHIFVTRATAGSHHNRKKASPRRRKVLGSSGAVDQPRSGKPNAKNRVQGFDGSVDNWTRHEKARRLDAGDRHIFDDCYPFPHRALYFARQRRFLRPRPFAPLGRRFH
jgi:hypothetical protein